MCPAETSRKFISLEMGRFLAALCVALDHLTVTGARLHFGTALPSMPSGMAVEFFFGLSGFVIYTAHAADFGRLSRLPAYIWRRLVRIFPLYWLSLLPMAYFLWPHFSHGQMLCVVTLAPFTHNLVEMNPPAWSLRFELTFYLIFGLALLPRVGRLVLPLWALLLGWQNYAPLLGLPGVAGFLPAGMAEHLLGVHNIMFLAGLGAGVLLRRAHLAGWHLWLLLALAGAIFLALLRQDQWGIHYPSPRQEPFLASAFALVLFALAALERGGQLRLPPGWGVLGALSYPLYVLHPCIGFLFTVYFYYHPAMHPAVPALLILLILLAASLLLAWLAWRWFDRPLQRMARRLT